VGQDNYVIVKLETEQDVDYYINFNRMAGINNETREGGDQVLITKQGLALNDNSTLLAKLSEGQSFEIADFDGTTQKLVQIYVNLINTAVSPGYALITIGSYVLGQPTAAPTPLQPTPDPTPAPSETPTLSSSPSLAPSSAPSLICNAHADCWEGLILARLPTYLYCKGGVCEEAHCDCNGTCEGSETKNAFPSDCVNENEKSSIETTMGDDNGSYGNQFDIMAKSDIQILRFDLHVSLTNQFIAKVFTKVGSYVGSETDSNVWTLIQEVAVTGQGISAKTSLPPLDNPVAIPAGQRQAFYVMSTGAGVRYTNGGGEGGGVGELYNSDTHIDFFEGVGKSGTFGSTFRHHIWNGEIFYVKTDFIPEEPSESPSIAPSSSSSEPSSDSSSKPSSSTAPSVEPTVAPSFSVAPSEQPSSKPSSSSGPSEMGQIK